MLTKIHLSAPVLLKTLPIKGFKHLSVSVAPTTRPQLKMAASALPDPFPSLVSAEWLHAHLSCVKVLDAHWYLPVPANRGKHALEDFCQNRIPTAQFFDLDGIVDHSTNLPHMLPSPEAFAAAADAFGVSNDDAIIIYDRTGVWSAPRAWFTWHVMGHKRVAVLDGGLSAWVDAGYPLDASPMDGDAANAASRAVKSPPPKEQLRYRANFDGNQVRSWEQVSNAISCCCSFETRSALGIVGFEKHSSSRASAYRGCMHRSFLLKTVKGRALHKLL
jgi:thiosulfate/3-mercaptopyruvate sulfurtransferase